MDPKRKELAHAKRKAGLLLAAAACLFAVTMLVPPNPWVHAIRAISEAAMVGGLADWFAVSALFRRIPTGIPFITAHTDVIPRSKDRIADNLSAFVKEKFLAPHSLVELIRQHDPSRYVAEWLTDPATKHKGLKDLARHRLGAEMTDIQELIGRGKAQTTFAEVPIETAAPCSIRSASSRRPMASRATGFRCSKHSSSSSVQIR